MNDLHLPPYPEPEPHEYENWLLKKRIAELEADFKTCEQSRDRMWDALRAVRERCDVRPVILYTNHINEILTIIDEALASEAGDE